MGTIMPKCLRPCDIKGPERRCGCRAPRPRQHGWQLPRACWRMRLTWSPCECSRTWRVCGRLQLRSWTPLRWHSAAPPTAQSCSASACCHAPLLVGSPSQAREKLPC